MDTNHNSHPVVNDDVGYDHSDLSVRGIIIFLVGVGAAGVVAHLIIWGMFAGAQKVVPYETNGNPMATQQTIQSAPPLQNAGPQSVAKFPEPQLQTNDAADMDTFKAQEENALHPAKPYQTSDGAIHIDINEAMNLVAQRGLPTRQPGQENAAQTPTAPKAPAAAKSSGTAGAK